ncbi:MAG: phosphoribosyl-ATP pyrophosphohydrolase [Clostridium sp.]
MSKCYDKLVRDKIPEVIRTSGKECEIVVAPIEERLELLERKLNEEVNEYLEDKNLEELADVMEVLFGIAHNMGYSEEDLIKKREEKLLERGGFKEGIVLKRTFSKSKENACMNEKL